MIRYLNWRGGQGRETIDELSRADFPSLAAMNAEMRRLAGECAMAGMGGAYWSSRPCNGWKD